MSAPVRTHQQVDDTKTQADAIHQGGQGQGGSHGEQDCIANEQRGEDKPVETDQDVLGREHRQVLVVDFDERRADDEPSDEGGDDEERQRQRGEHLLSGQSGLIRRERFHCVSIGPRRRLGSLWQERKEKDPTALPRDVVRAIAPTFTWRDSRYSKVYMYQQQSALSSLSTVIELVTSTVRLFVVRRTQAVKCVDAPATLRCLYCAFTVRS